MSGREAEQMTAGMEGYLKRHWGSAKVSSTPEAHQETGRCHASLRESQASALPSWEQNDQ